jgi:predicted transcriptional regulator
VAAADIEAGLREADKGEFATDAQVAATIAKYTRRNRGK